jgi:hypothetical protein
VQQAEQTDTQEAIESQFAGVKIPFLR